MPSFEEDQKLLIELAKEAGQIALSYFKQDPETWMKTGNSPVTEADLAVDTFLKTELLKARPDYGWLSEETDDNEERLDRQRTFVVDPIDGTRGFIGGQDQWCVSIAIVEDHRPVAAVLECPALQETYCAIIDGGAWMNGDPLTVSQMLKKRPVRITGSRVFLKGIEQREDVEAIPFVPSLAYRIAMVASGQLDVAIARASARDWDLAAADLIVHEAGGRLTDFTGTILSYNCRSTRQGALLASPLDHHEDMLTMGRNMME